MEDNNINMLLDNFLDALSTIKENSPDKSACELAEDFNALPKEYQKELLVKMLDHLKFYTHINQEQLNQKKCEMEGHIYGDWYESVSFKCYKGSSFRNRIWCKKCARCGNVEITFVKPQELVKIDEEQEIKNEIEVLQKKLIRLKNEK